MPYCNDNLIIQTKIYSDKNVNKDFLQKLMKL